MLKNEREQEITNILKEKRYITVKALSKMLYASESSIRRSLVSLEQKGIIKRSYGGAELLLNSTNITTFAARAHQSVEAKKEIAKKAVLLIKEGDIIFLDQSSTSLYLAYELASKSNITVMTNSLEIINFLAGTEVSVFSSGGMLYNANRSCFVGNQARSGFESVFADFMFFSAKSISYNGEISDCSMEEVDIRTAMFKNSAKKVFLCDSKKFGTHSAFKQCELKDIDYIISEGETAKIYENCKDGFEIL